MAVFDTETFLGSVSGGCIEAEVIVAAEHQMTTMKTERHHFGISDEMAWTSGLPCGGNLQILVEPLRGPADAHLAESILAARKARRTVLIESNLATGERTLHQDKGSLEAPFVEMFVSGKSGLVLSHGQEVFAHVFAPAPRLLIVGATHIAQALVAIAGTVGLTPTVIDPRESFASQARFQGTEIVHGWPQEVMAGLGLDEHTGVIALAHVEHIDDEALACALSSPAGYIGALGSTRNHARRKDRLMAAGFTQAAVERIRSPIGLDIGAVTPQEIALAIAAEAVHARRGPKRPTRPCK